MLSFASFACREIQVYEPFVPSAAYGLSGRVTTPSDVPIESVAVRLSYVLAPFDTTQLDTVKIVVDNRAHYFLVDVYNIQNKYVRTLFSGYPQSGTFPRFGWDGRDDSNHLVASGKYQIRYVRDATILKIVPFLIGNLITAWTDFDGNFSIGKDNLPIRELFDTYDLNGNFIGVYQVTPQVNLDFSRGTLHKGYSVTLQLNNIYHGVYILK